MNLTGFALNSNRLVMLAAVVFMIVGAWAWTNSPSLEDPPILVRNALVVAANPGLSAREMERLVTKKLETEINQMKEIDNVWSVSETGFTIIHVELQDRFFDLDIIWQDLRNKMLDVAPELPEGTIGPFVNDDFGDVFQVVLAITASTGFTQAEMFRVAKDARDILYAVPGVSKIEMIGVQTERVFLNFSNARLAQFGIDPQVLAREVARQNVRLSGGKVRTGSRDVIIDATGNLEDVSQIEQLLIRIPDTETSIALRDIATVTRGYVDPPQQPAYFNGRPAIVLPISMTPGENVVAFGPRVLAKADEIEQTLPIGFNIEVVNYSPAFVESAVNAVATNLYQTIAIVLAVIIVFMGLRMGLIIGLHVPLTMLFAVMMMFVLGIELQRISLATLIISLGMLVDNGINVAENIKRLIDEGVDRAEAAIQTGKQMARPLLTVALIISAGFMPLLIASSENATGEYTKSLSQVILITLLGSWALALTVTPNLCVWFVKATSNVGTAQKKGLLARILRRKSDQPQAAASQSAPQESAFLRSYRTLLTGILRARIVFLVVVVGAFVGSLYLFTLVPVRFLPESDRNQVMIKLNSPTSYGIEQTQASILRLVDWLMDREANPEVVRNVAYVGGGGPRFFITVAPEDPFENMGFLHVTVRSLEDVEPMVERLRSHILENFPEFNARVLRMFFGNKETGLVELRISGPDADRLFQHAKQAEAAFQRLPGSHSVRIDWENSIVKLAVKVDQRRARRAGVTTEDIANSLETALNGTEITTFREDDETIPVLARLESEERFNIDRIRTLNVYSSARGVNVPLVQVADFGSQVEFGRIMRRNLQRTVTIEGKSELLTATDIQETLTAPGGLIESLDLSSPYSFEWGGEIESSERALGALIKPAPVAGLIIVLLLVWQFNSILRAAVILMIVPLGIIGATIGLLVSGSFFGFMAIMGMFALIGLIISNTLVLIERIEQEIADGKKPYDAIVTACVSRLRPILMTSLTTILGMIPIIASRDPLFYDMANVIAFGLAIATVLSLGVLPVLYSLVFRVRIPERGQPS